MPAKILIVEDDETLRGLLQDTLQNEGYEVLEAKNGKGGLKRALEDRPALILLDIVLPDIDGIDVLRQIRDDEAWGRLANVVMLTNLSDSKSVADCLALGAHSFLVKSDWKIQDIMRVVHEELGDEQHNPRST